MNVRRLNRIAKILEAERKPGLPKFNMGSWIDVADSFSDTVSAARESLRYRPLCGTTACIAGYACFLYPKEKAGSFLSSGSRILGLEESTAERLFLGRFNPEVANYTRDVATITAQEAAVEIRRMVSAYRKQRKATRDKGRKRSGKRKPIQSLDAA